MHICIHVHCTYMYVKGLNVNILIEIVKKKKLKTYQAAVPSSVSRLRRGRGLGGLLLPHAPVVNGLRVAPAHVGGRFLPLLLSPAPARQGCPQT